MTSTKKVGGGAGQQKVAPTNDELLAQFDDLGVEDTPLPSTKKQPGATASVTPQQTAKKTGEEQDPLAELNNLVSQRPVSRPNTPGVKPGQGGESGGGGGSRKSGESTTTTTGTEKVFTPVTTGDSPEPVAESNKAETGGWWGSSAGWGGLLATATKAVGQAQAAVKKELEKNEEAQRWTEQIRGMNVGTLKGLGGNLQHLQQLGFGTFQDILHVVAPPISSHEQLQIHITHDFSNYPSLDPTIYSVFSRIMSQVEGGSLMVIQRGQESSPRREGDRASNSAGWNDGPWWRSVGGGKRSLNAVQGLVPGTKLARASAESYSNEFFSARGGVEAAAKAATEVLSESNPTRSSDIFLAIQAVREKEHGGQDLFSAGPSSSPEKETSGVKEPDPEPVEEIFFAIYLHDPIHSISYATVSQSVPAQWLDWLDADPTSTSESSSGELPESIVQIIESGGVDPREWIAEWVEEILSLSIGVIAQKYVARRMGVGEGNAAVKGKMKAGLNEGEVVTAGGGEAARAVAGL